MSTVSTEGEHISEGLGLKDLRLLWASGHSYVRYAIRELPIERAEYLREELDLVEGVRSWEEYERRWYEVNDPDGSRFPYARALAGIDE